MFSSRSLLSRDGQRGGCQFGYVVLPRVRARCRSCLPRPVSMGSGIMRGTLAPNCTRSPGERAGLRVGMPWVLETTWNPVSQELIGFLPQGSTSHGRGASSRAGHPGHWQPSGGGAGVGSPITACLGLLAPWGEEQHREQADRPDLRSPGLCQLRELVCPVQTGPLATRTAR